MDHRAPPYRSVLYIPGSKPRALEKAKGLPVDAIIFDLEDAVSAEEKPAARALLAETLAQGGYGPRAQIVRINGFDTEWGADDLDTIAAARPQAILRWYLTWSLTVSRNRPFAVPSQITGPIWVRDPECAKYLGL